MVFDKLSRLSNLYNYLSFVKPSVAAYYLVDHDTMGVPAIPGNSFRPWMAKSTNGMQHTYGLSRLCEYSQDIYILFCYQRLKRSSAAFISFFVIFIKANHGHLMHYPRPAELSKQLQTVTAHLSSTPSQVSQTQIPSFSRHDTPLTRPKRHQFIKIFALQSRRIPSVSWHQFLP